MKKAPGHFCRICGKRKPNEQFSGRGRRTHVCKVCAKEPKHARDTIEQKDVLFGYLEQSHISDKNVAQVKKLSDSDNKEVAEPANIVLEVAAVKPYKKRRLKVPAEMRPDLLDKLEEMGLVFDHDGY